MPKGWLLGTACAVWGSCALEPLPETVFFEDAVLQLVASREAKTDRFIRVNTEAYPTALATGDFINVYVSKADAEDFIRIDPEFDGSGVSLSSNAHIVREVLSPSGDVKSVTLMVRGPDGYYPDAGNFYFAVVTVDGVALSTTCTVRIGTAPAVISNEMVMAISLASRAAIESKGLR